MAGIFGIIAVALGLCLLWAWWPVVWGLLKALIALSLLFWGLVAVVVQHSKNKARLDRERARRDEPALSAAPGVQQKEKELDTISTAANATASESEASVLKL